MPKNEAWLTMALRTPDFQREEYHVARFGSMRLARLIGLLALLATLGLPQPAKAQEQANYGVVCDTPDQVRRFVLAPDAKAILARINAEKAQTCAVMNVMFHAGKTDGKIVTKDGVWTITHALVVGIIQHGGGFQPMEPKLQWIAVAVPSKSA
jgi:hypothetical protein